MKMRTEEANPKDYQIKVNLWVDFIEIFSIFASEIWKMYTFDKIRDGVYAVRYPDEEDHDSWLRIYAIKLDPGVYVITGGAIKLARKMQDAVATSSELQRLNDLKQYFVDNGALVL